MLYVVEYVGDDRRVYARVFIERSHADSFSREHTERVLEYYSEELVAQGDGFTEFRRIRREFAPTKGSFVV